MVTTAEGLVKGNTRVSRFICKRVEMCRLVGIQGGGGDGGLGFGAGGDELGQYPKVRCISLMYVEDIVLVTVRLKRLRGIAK